VRLPGRAAHQTVTRQGTAKLRRVVNAWVLAPLLCWLVACEPFPGEIRKTDDIAGSKFTIRVQIYDEGNKAHMFAPGCHVRLYSAAANSEDWRQFANAYYSECDQIPETLAGFVNDDTAYAYLQWRYLVTRNAGTTWSSWVVPEHLSDRTYYNTRLIQAVAVAPDGMGTMTLNPEGVRGGAALTLSTQDFGLHWSLQ